MDEKKWLYLQRISFVFSILLAVLFFIVLGERHSDGTFTLGEPNIWSGVIVVLMIVSVFVGALIEVAKRTEKRITLKTIILTIVWFLGIVLVLQWSKSIRSGQFLLMLIWPQ